MSPFGEWRDIFRSSTSVERHCETSQLVVSLSMAGHSPTYWTSSSPHLRSNTPHETLEIFTEFPNRTSDLKVSLEFSAFAGILDAVEFPVQDCKLSYFIRREEALSMSHR